MRRRLLGVFLALVLVFPMACAKTSAGGAETGANPDAGTTAVAAADTSKPEGQAAREGEDDLKLIEDFIKSSETPEDFTDEELEAIYPYVSNRLFALLSCSGKEDEARWLELYDGMVVTVTYYLQELNHYERGSLGPDGRSARVETFRESANYENEDFAAVFRDTVKYSLDGYFQQSVCITVKGRIDGSRKLQDAELISWSVEDKYRDMFESMRLDALREIDEDGVVVDYDYIWSKYSEQPVTFEHQAGVNDPLEYYVPSEEEIAAAKAAEEAAAVKLPFSQNNVGQIFSLLNDCTGKDLDTAVEMVEDYFGTQLVHSGSNMMTENDVTVAQTTYYIQLEKDGLRFNRVTFSCNMTDGAVCGVELGIRNEQGDRAYAELTPVPELPEVSDMYAAFTNEAVTLCGEPYDSGNINWDEDSYWAKFRYGLDCVIKLELYNYSSDDENGLIAGKFAFNNNSYNGAENVEK